jgi:FtsZ-interacting cell division protein ZipA
MPAWGWVLIAVAVVAVLAVAVWQMLARRRTARLQQRFGPEYQRTLRAADSRREAEAQLQARQQRREQLEIRPLSQTAHDRYVQSWQAVQVQFVDEPRAAVAAGDGLIQNVMVERGYPIEQFEQRADDISVDYPQLVEHYRQGHRLAQMSAQGEDSTESLRQAMRHYRALFEELVEPASDEPVTRGRTEDEDLVDQSRAGTQGRKVR